VRILEIEVGDPGCDLEAGVIEVEESVSFNGSSRMCPLQLSTKRLSDISLGALSSGWSDY
jgi:hypothetical protein